jgi:hypothetical protein
MGTCVTEEKEWLQAQIQREVAATEEARRAGEHNLNEKMVGFVCS